MTSRMTALDGSALFAILLGEPDADRCREALQAGGRLLLSAGSLIELLIVADAKQVRPEMAETLALIRPEIVALTAHRAHRAHAAADGYRRWGKGFHPAGLNLVDSFAYALAIEHRCPLLYVGRDFAKTDVISALK